MRAGNGSGSGRGLRPPAASTSLWPWVRNMSERVPALDDATMQVGLLMESAQTHQRLAETQLEKLRMHTQDLDGVVRDEIRRTLVQELSMLTTETARATRELEKIRRGAAR